MTDDYGELLETLAFQSMSTKTLIGKIADALVEESWSVPVWHPHHHFVTRERVEARVAELVERHGSIGGNLTRVKLVSKIMKRVRTLRWKKHDEEQKRLS